MPAQDLIIDGNAQGDVASRLLACNMDARHLRPFIGNDGRSYISQDDPSGKRDDNGNPIQVAVPVRNTTATLRKEEWIMLDTAITKAALPRLKAVADLRAAGLTYSVPGMNYTVLQSERMSDINPAVISMDPDRESPSDRPHFDLVGLPLPITHKDFHFSARQLAVSRNGQSPLDTSMAEGSGRKVAEMIEQLTLGTLDEYAFGGYTLYGYTNFPSALTKVITSPEASGWVPLTLLNEVLDMRGQARSAYHFGPYLLYFSSAWDRYLDSDYSTAYPAVTVRDRLLKLDDINDIRTLDYLSGYQILLIQMTTDVVRLVMGMDITTIQWETHGGMRLNFKVLALIVPQLRADFNGNTGIVHGKTF